jgi:hypothetical protein
MMARKFGVATKLVSSNDLAKAVARSLEAAFKRKLSAEAKLRRRLEFAARCGSLFTGAAIVGMA